MWKSVKRLILETSRGVQTHNVPTLAAALAFFATFSVVPGVILLVAVGGMFLGEQATRAEVLAQLQLWIGTTGADFVEGAVANRAESDGASFWASTAGVALVLVGATRFFAELQFALNTVWDVEPRRRVRFLEILRKRALSFALILVLVLFLIASIAVSAVVAALAKYAQPVLSGYAASWELANFAISFVLSAVLLTLVLKYFPDAKIRWRDAAPGAALTAFTLLLGKFALGYYIGQSAFASTYGAAGSIIVFLIFVYLAATIVLVGAEFTQVWARHHGQKIVPESHARRVRRRFGRRRPASADTVSEEE